MVVKVVVRMTAPVPIYTPPEAVQIRIGNRWRNATVEKVKQHRGFVEVVVTYLDRGTTRRAMLASNSPDLRKWGEGKIAKPSPGPGAWKPRKRKRWSDALVE